MYVCLTCMSPQDNVSALTWRYSALSQYTSMHNTWWRQTKYNKNTVLQCETWFINFQKAVQGDGSGKKKLKPSNTCRQLLTAVTAFALEDQLEIHVICSCTVTQHHERGSQGAWEWNGRVWNTHGQSFTASDAARLFSHGHFSSNY